MNLTSKMLFDFLDKHMTTSTKEKIKEDIEKNLVFSAIGGRTCYSQSVIDEINNNEARLTYNIVDYLNRIARLHHFSIFSHTYVTFNIKDIKINNNSLSDIIKVANIYKLNINDVEVSKDKSTYYVDLNITITLRHLLELFYQVSEKHDDFLNELFNYFSINQENVINNALDKIEILKNNYTEITSYLDVRTGFTYYIYPLTNHIFIILDNIPRYISHQIVRHTSLNFSQQSQRYVKLKLQNNTTLNPLTYLYLKEKLNLPDYKISMIQNDVLHSNVKYINYLSEMPAEISRLILPEQTSTILTLSGSYDDVMSFIEKRLDNHAQYEIKKIAEVVYENIKKERTE